METRVADARELLREAVDGGRPPDLAALRSASPTELGDGLNELNPAELGSLFTRLGEEALADLVAELDPFTAARLLGKLSRGQAADVLEEMDPDDAADVVEEFADQDAEAILDEMEQEEARDVRDLLSYPPESAAGIMTPDYVALPPEITADEALARLRRVAEEAETVYYVYVTEPATNRLLGVLSLHKLAFSRPSTLISDLMVSDIAKIRADADQETAARLLDQRNLIALPVVDGQDRLLGIITADDAADVLLEEAGEDIERLGGSQPLEEPYLQASIFHLVRKRILWLMVLFVGGAITASVLSDAQDIAQEVIELTFFTPMLIGIGGNVGSQTVTTLVRAMAVGEVRFRDVPRVLGRELAVGSIIGIVLGLVTYVRAWMLGVGPEIGPIVGLAAVGIVVWAAAVAAVLPLVLQRLKIDPAVVSAPFITTLVDGTGLFFYFMLARRLLNDP